jgi:hypothetical protein
MSHLFYIGIDLGNSHHAVCIVDAARKVIKQKQVSHDRTVIELITEVCSPTGPSQIAVALEDKNNVVVDALVALGFAVFTINPKQVDRFRDRHSVAGCKDDRRDALVLATSLVTDMAAFRALPAPSGDDVVLSGKVQELERLNDDHRRLSNQLRAAILRFFPALLSLCDAADEPWFWALVLLLGDAENAVRVEKSSIETLLKQHRKRAVTAEHVSDVIARRHLRPSDAVRLVGREKVGHIVQQLRLVDEQRKKMKEQLKEVQEAMKSADPAAPSDVDILRSMPGIGPKVTAALMGYAGSLLRSGDLSILRGMCGVAPVTKRSGKSHLVNMRFACNAALREAMFHAANAAAVHDDHFKQLYAGLATKGHSHARILRGIGDRMLHIVVAMFRSRTLYAQRAISAAA